MSNKLIEYAFKIILAKRICGKCGKTIKKEDGLINFKTKNFSSENWGWSWDVGNINICLKCWNKMKEDIDKQMEKKEEMFKEKSKKHFFKKL